ncbi:putative transcription factor tau subunit sfc1 [Triangularia verruculosa]|uniref:Transcription factor tau subunit sfc1 n=1 Tax=Triangularia verruculosa TaxID=2587418 RepID=A0AAN7AUT0_9PEZI|nr:putative transcription factor tau subunit sfc1 [Triangularia verruculosa]
MDRETQQDEEQAPIYTIPSRRLGALEHPMIIKNLDKGIKTLGQNNAFQAILDSASPQISVPLYLRPDNPTARPLTSHNALTHNVVLKVTVPKRTGRKRKRGTDGPWEGEVLPPSDSSAPEVQSRDRLDLPRVIRRKLQDNVGAYTVEPVGIINNTHRYRGLADFQYSLSHSKFMNKFVQNVLPGDISKLKNFTLTPGIETGKDIDLIPPPYFTPMSLPFSYGYNQNPHTKELASAKLETGEGDNSDEDDEYARVVNVTARGPAAGYFIAQDEYPVPTAPKKEPDMSDPQIAAIINEMRAAMEERPIWTRRSMWNRLGAKFAELPKNGGLVRHCLQFAGYQFKGGPWRDALVKYGLDPRTDPKYRVYQTLIFKLHKTRIGSVGRSWQAVRRNEISVTNFGRYWRELGVGNGAARGGMNGVGRVDEALLKTHVFDGESFSTDGKVWQVIDITDPLLKSLFESAEVRTVCDNEVSGYYHRVLWSVAKAIMKTKMLAIRFNRELRDDDFSAALEAVRGPENGGDGGGGRSIGISLPDLNLSPEECEQLRGHKMRPGVKQGTKRDRWAEKKKKTHYRVRIPLKDVEEKEARKMIWLLTRHAEKPAAEGEEAIDPALAAVGVTTTTDEQVPATTAEKDKAQKPPQQADDVMPSIEGTGEEEEEEEEEGGVLQDILDDMEGDEEGSSTSDSEGEENEAEEEESSLEEEEDEEEEEEDEEEEDSELDGERVDQDRGMAIPTSKKTVTSEDGLAVVQEEFDYDEMEEGDYDEEGYVDDEEMEEGYDEDEEGYYEDEDGYPEEEYYDEEGADGVDGGQQPRY